MDQNSLDNGSGQVNPDGSGLELYAPTSNGLTPEPQRRRLGMSGKTQQESLGDRNPIWADNGQKIIYVTDVDGNNEIYIMDADGTNRVNLTNDPGSDTSPVWSESEGKILFISDRAGNDDVFIMNADGSGQTNITNSVGDESDPQFFISPPPPDPPSIAEGGVVMSNLLPTVNEVSPRSIISVFGANFSTGTTLFPTLDGNGELDRNLAGTCLEMNGERLPIFAVTPGQINAQASDVGALGPASFTVITDCDTPNALRSETARAVSSGVEMATIEQATPVFFIFDPVAADGNIAARFNATESQAPVPVASAEAFPNDSFGPSRPAKPGDIVLLYGTGWGETDPPYAAGELAAGAAQVLPEAGAMVSFGGIIMDAADVLYVGVTPGSAGLYQLAIRIPANAQPGNNEVVLTVYSKSTPVGPIIPVAAP